MHGEFMARAVELLNQLQVINGELGEMLVQDPLSFGRPEWVDKWRRHEELRDEWLSVYAKLRNLP